jgi:hypothetical protein
LNLNNKKTLTLRFDIKPRYIVVKAATGKAVLEKWSIYANPAYKRTLKIYATRNNKKEYSVTDEALKEYIENHKIKD